MKPVVLATLSGSLFLAGCSLSQPGVAAGERQVAAFHRLLDKGRYDEIYDGADDAYKKTTSRSDSDRYLKELHDGYGHMETSAVRGWRISTATTGTYVLFSYLTRCRNGDVDESFTWREDGDAVKLVGYDYRRHKGPTAK